MLLNLQLLVKKRMSGDERINAPPVCIFQIIVALYQSRTPLGSDMRYGRISDFCYALNVV